MPSYMLRAIDPDLWARFRARAEREGRPLRALLLALIERYILKGLD
jgi:hypothetical protein